MAMAPRAIFRRTWRTRCSLRRDRTSPDRCTGCLIRSPSPGMPSPSARGPARPSGQGLCSPSCSIWHCSLCWSARSIERSRRSWISAGSRPTVAAGAVAEGTAWRIFPSPRRAPALQPPRQWRRLFRRRSLPHHHRHRSSLLRHQPWRRRLPLPGQSLVEPTPRQAPDLGPGAGRVEVQAAATAPERGPAPGPAPVEGREDWRAVLVRAPRCGPPSTSSPKSFAVDHCT